MHSEFGLPDFMAGCSYHRISVTCFNIYRWMCLQCCCYFYECFVCLFVGSDRSFIWFDKLVIRETEEMFSFMKHFASIRLYSRKHTIFLLFLNSCFPFPNLIWRTHLAEENRFIAIFLLFNDSILCSPNRNEVPNEAFSILIMASQSNETNQILSYFFSSSLTALHTETKQLNVFIMNCNTVYCVYEIQFIFYLEIRFCCYNKNTHTMVYIWCITVFHLHLFLSHWKLCVGIYLFWFFDMFQCTTEHSHTHNRHQNQT